MCLQTCIDKPVCFAGKLKANKFKKNLININKYKKMHSDVQEEFAER